VFQSGISVAFNRKKGEGIVSSRRIWGCVWGVEKGHIRSTMNRSTKGFRPGDAEGESRHSMMKRIDCSANSSNHANVSSSLAVFVKEGCNPVVGKRRKSEPGAAWSRN